MNTEVDTFFMSVLGLLGPGDFSSVDVSARAVAKAECTQDQTGSGGYAVFATETGCGNAKSLDISGSDDFFIGRVHSNSDIEVSGSINDFDGDTTYVCGLNNGGGGNTYNPPHAPGSVEPDPLFGLSHGDFCPPTALGFTGSSDWDLSSDGSWWVGGSKSSKQLRPGVYCSSGLIKLSDSDISVATEGGETGITFVGQKVEISGFSFVLTPYSQNILFAAWATADDAMKIAGSGGDWVGLIYAPNGTAELSGQANGNDDFDLGGGVIAERVKLNGSDAHIDGTIGASPAQDPTQVIALIE